MTPPQAQASALVMSPGPELRAKAPKKPDLGTIAPECTVDPLLDPVCENGTRLGVFTISPRISVAGGSFTASWSSGCMINPPFADPPRPCYYRWEGFVPDGWKSTACNVDTPSCTIRIPKNVRTTPFRKLCSAMQNEQGVGPACRYHAILGGDQAVIQGTVRDAGVPAKGATVSVGGQTLRTDEAGFYWTTVDEGESYKVSLNKADACVVGQSPCRSFTTVKAGGARVIDFTIEPRAELSLRFDAGEQGFEPDGTRFLRLRLTVKNAGKLPLTDVELSDLAINPLDKKSQFGLCAQFPSIALARGPNPSPPTALDPGQSVALAYRVHVAAACGPVRIGAYVSGKDPGGVEQRAARGIDLDVDDRVAERAIQVMGTFDALQRASAEALAARRAALEAQLNAGLPKTADGTYKAALEDWLGVPRGGLAWMPKNSDQSIRLYDAYTSGMQAETLKMFEEFSWKVGNGFTAAFDLMFNDGRMSNKEGALWAMRATDTLLALGPSIKDTSKTWLGTSWRDLTGNAPPGSYDAVTGEIYRNIAAFDLSANVTSTIDGAADDYRGAIVQFQKDYDADPQKATQELGRAAARFQVSAMKALLTEIVTEKGLGMMMRSLSKTPFSGSSRFLNDGLDEGLSGAFEQRRGLQALPDGAVVTLDEASQLGGIRADRLDRARQLIAGLEAKGIKDVRISFTPSNPLSMDLVQDGLHVVKEEFQTGSTITKLDLLLGADPMAAGRYAVFKPRWPAIGQEQFLAKLPPGDRPAVLKWFSDRERQYADAVAGTHPIARAAKEGGARFEISAGAQQPKKYATWEVDIEKYGDTWLPRNKALDIDGTPVGKPGMYTTADLDIHAYSAKSPSAINPLALRDAMKKADLGVPFHGSTVNAWDLDPNKPGDWVTYFKFQLAQMDPAEAERLAQSCADSINKRFENAAWVEKKVTAADLLSPKMTNKVLTVTRDNVVIEFGPRPRP